MVPWISQTLPDVSENVLSVLEDIDYSLSLLCNVLKSYICLTRFLRYSPVAMYTEQDFLGLSCSIRDDGKKIRYVQI